MRRSEVNQFVTLEGAYLAEGDTLRGVECPVCHGGTSHEKTFSITRVAEGLVYNCFRASCDGARGFVPTAGVLLPASPERARDDGLRPYKGPILPLAEKDIQFFRKRFDLIVQKYDLGVTEYGEYVFNIRDPQGRTRGRVVRQIPWNPTEARPYSPPRPSLYVGSVTKTKAFPEVPGPFQGWYEPAHEHADYNPVVMVEDALSAMKVAQAGFKSVALLGTYVNNDRVREIAMQKPTEVVIALDNDATSVAFKIARQYGLAFPKVRVAMLSCDTKDMDADKVASALGL